eukprot:gene5343-12937_t
MMHHKVIILAALSLLAAVRGDNSCRCPQIPNFYFYPQLDHPNDNIQCKPRGNQDQYALAKDCTNNIFCTAFSVYKESGDASEMSCSKYVTSPVDIQSPQRMGNCQGIYVKIQQPTGCPQISGYTTTQNVDNPDGNIAQAPMDIITIAAACNGDCRCLSFNSQGFTKTTSAASITSPGMCFYTKRAPIACAPPPSPPPPPQLPTTFVRSMSIGSAHTCALMSSGRVKCWGDNIYGQLGYGSNGPIDGIVDVDLGGGTYASAISAGNFHTCALLSTGRIKCWGLNTNGQLGQGCVSTSVGSNSGDMGDNLPVVDLGRNAFVVAVTAGGMHTCALLQGGTVKCFGLNTFGQLGQGDTFLRGKESNTMGDNLYPINLGRGELAIEISTGWFHTCALLLNSRVKCWGFNLFGQLGLADGTTLSRGSMPSDMGEGLPAVGLGGRSTSIRSNGHHTCVTVSTDPRLPLALKCWGSNKYAELGQGNTYDWGKERNSMDNNLPPVELGRGRSPFQVAPGSSYTCATLDDRSVKCWGFNGYGNLGLETSATSVGDMGSMGDRLPAVNLGSGFVAESVITGFGSTTCAVLNKGAAVKCWGRNNKGQRGEPGFEDKGQARGDMGDNLRPINLYMPAAAKAGQNKGIAAGNMPPPPSPGESCQICVEVSTSSDQSGISFGGKLFGPLLGAETGSQVDLDATVCIDLTTFFSPMMSPITSLSDAYCTSSSTKASVCANGSKNSVDEFMNDMNLNVGEAVLTLALLVITGPLSCTHYWSPLDQVEEWTGQ